MAAGEVPAAFITIVIRVNPEDNQREGNGCAKLPENGTEAGFPVCKSVSKGKPRLFRVLPGYRISPSA